MRAPPYRQAGRSAAGPVPGSGPCPRRTLPTFRVVRSALSARRVPGAPAARAQPARRCHPLLLSRRSWLHHRLVSATPNRFADSLGTSLLLDVDFVVVGEFAHRRSEDRRSCDAEAAQRESLHMSSQFVEPGEVSIAS